MLIFETLPSNSSLSHKIVIVQHKFRTMTIFVRVDITQKYLKTI